MRRSQYWGREAGGFGLRNRSREVARNSPVAAKEAVDKPRAEAVEKQPQAATPTGDKERAANFDGADDLDRHVARGHPTRFGPGKAFVFEQRVEVFALRRAGGDQEQVDAEAGEFWPKCFGEAMKRVLARRIDAFVRCCPFAENRPDVDDDRVSACAKQGDGLADQCDRREEVCVHDRPNAVRVRFGETAVRGDAGVVDEDIEAAKLIARGREGAFSIVGIGHIPHSAHSAAAKPRNFFSHACEPILPACEQDEIDVVSRELDRKCAPNSAGCTGNECAAAFEVPVRHAPNIAEP